MPRFTYTTVIKLTNAITAEIIAIISGDQNPVLTGLFVGFTPVGIPVDVPVGVSVGVGDDAWVTVKVVVATPPSRLSVAVTVYVSRGTGGTVNSMLATLYEYPVVIVPTFVVSRVMLTGSGAWNPDIVTTTIVPAGPSEGFKVTDRFSAFATGVIIAAKVNMLRKSSTSVALLNLFSITIKHFCNEIVLLPY